MLMAFLGFIFATISFLWEVPADAQLFALL